MTTTAHPQPVPAAQPPQSRRPRTTLLSRVATAAIGSALWSSAGYLAAHLSLHWH